MTDRLTNAQTIRLADPPLADTTLLLYRVLEVTLHGNYALFLCPAGESRALLARLRMQLSRQRKKLKESGKSFHQFTLHSTVHPETHEGTRFDAIVMWKQQSRLQTALQEIESIMSKDAI